MTSSDTRKEKTIDPAKTGAFIQRLWQAVFSKGVAGLADPADIQRLGQDRRTVRAGELREVARIQRELQSLLDGKTHIDSSGKIRESVDDSLLYGVRISSVIEREQGTDNLIEPLDVVRMLQKVDLALKAREVRYELTVRHIYILAEEEYNRLPLDEMSTVTVNPGWMASWREAAGQASSIRTKYFWARLLAGEVLRPGTYSVRVIDFLRTISNADMEMIGICARFCFDGFIYRNPGRYFSEDLHKPLFEVLEELGVLRGVYGKAETWLLTSASGGAFRVILPCQRRAIFVEGDQAEDDVRFPVYRLTRFGREVFSLCKADADTAYLLSVANDLKKRGLRVQLGDWVEESGQGLFAERMSL